MLNEPSKYIVIDGDLLAHELLRIGIEIDVIIQLIDKIEKERKK